MNLYLHHERWWQIVYPPSGALHSHQKGCIIGAVRSLLPELTYIFGGTPRFTSVTSLKKTHLGDP